MRQIAIRYVSGLLLAASVAAPVLARNSAQDPSGAAGPTPAGAFLYVYRTPSHIRYSSSSVFYQVSAKVSEYLAAKHVNVVKVKEDDSGPQTVIGENVRVTPGEGKFALPQPDLLKDARAAGASHLLVLEVDRPFKSWVKLTLQCFDLSGNVLWQETASNWTALTGSQGLKSTLQRLTKRLDSRIGQPGFPLQNGEQVVPSQMAATKEGIDDTAGTLVERQNLESTKPAAAAMPGSGSPGESREGAIQREGTVVLPKGTKVKTVLVAAVNSRNAKPGDTIDLRVLDDVKVGDLIVIARKAAVSGRVTAVVPPQRRQRPGSITIKMTSVSLVTQQNAGLHGVWTIRSGNANLAIENAGETVDLIQSTGGFGVFFLPLFMLKHGEHVILPAGLELTAEMEEDVVLESNALIQAGPAPSKERHGNPVVTVYHFSNPASDRPKFYCGKVEVARLRHGTVFQFALPPGQYWFRAQSKKHAVHLTLEDGGEYYLRVDSVMTSGNPHNPGYSQFVHIRQQDIAEIETSAASPLDPKSIKDISRIDLAALQAPE